VGRVDGRRGLLHGARVVDRLAIAGDEVGVLDLDHAPGGAGWTLDATPRVLDERADGLARCLLWPDAHDVDPRRASAFVGRVVALPATETFETFRTERAPCPVRTS